MHPKKIDTFGCAYQTQFRFLIIIKIFVHYQHDKSEFICEEYINENYIFCTESWCFRYPQF
jgi:hypothetical protein